MRLTVKQAAARMDVSPSLVYSLLKQGRIPAMRIGCRGRGCWRIEESAVEAFLDTCKADPKLPPLKHIR